MVGTEKPGIQQNTHTVYFKEKYPLGQHTDEFFRKLSTSPLKPQIPFIRNILAFSPPLDAYFQAWYDDFYGGFSTLDL